MGYLINRCKVYEILYLSGLSKQKSSQAETNLKNAAVQLYATILKFFAAATKLYQGPLGYRALQAILNLDKISELIDECQKWATIAHVEADNCERDLSRSARTKSQDAHEELKKLLQELHETFNKTVIVKWVKSEERVQFLRWISDLPFEDVHSVAKNGRTQGTGQWLLNHDALRHWRLDDGPGILWLHGLRTFTLQKPSSCSNTARSGYRKDQTGVYSRGRINSTPRYR
jgi:polyhydroxyalkanoate synthesis regulator phasin